MAILKFTLDVAGQVGVVPRRIKILSTDNLATVTAAGYLNGLIQEGQAILPTDVIDMIYSYNISTNTGTYSTFIPAFTAGVPTLSLWSNPGNVLLPVVSGDFAIFNGTTGQIKDGGFSPTDSAKTKVVMLNAAPTINHVAIFTNANGTIGDGGVLGTAAAKAASDNTKANLASISAATVSGQLAQFNDTAGTIGDSGILAADVQTKTNILANSASWSGGSASHAFTITGITASSIVIPAIQAQTTGTVVIDSYTVGSNTLTVTFSADPGAMVLQYVAFIAAQ